MARTTFVGSFHIDDGYNGDTCWVHVCRSHNGEYLAVYEHGHYVIDELVLNNYASQNERNKNG